MKTRRDNTNKRALPKLRISPVLYVMIASFVAFGYFKEVASYLVAVVLHEIGHAVVAAKRGYKLIEFRLMPYGAALIGEFESAPARDEIAIAAAGPLTNFLLLLLTVSAWWLFPSLFGCTSCFAAANVCLIAVNLLPVYPLDGGRILLATLTRTRPRSVALKRMKIISYAVGGAFVALFLCSFMFGVNFSFATMAAFIVSSAALPQSSGGYESIYRAAYRSDRIARGLEVRRIMVSPETAAGRMRKTLSPDKYTVFSVVSPSSEPLGELTELDVDGVYPNVSAGEMLENRRETAKNRRKF